MLGCDVPHPHEHRYDDKDDTDDNRDHGWPSLTVLFTPQWEYGIVALIRNRKEETVDDTGIVYDSYTREQLTEAFNLVKPARNWKLAIDANVPADADLRLLNSAVVFFTGGIISYDRQADGTIRVTSPGYYAEIGA